MSSTKTTDHWITHAQGNIFARLWHGENTGAAPIVLMHDSLGAVDVWRTFPATLSEATGRKVVAYDRLGFGRSDARMGLPALDFVADESRTYLPALLEQLAIRRFVALGHSVGGGMAIEVAAQMHQACEAVVAIAAQIFPEKHTLEAIRAAAPYVRSAEQLEKLAKYHGEKSEWVVRAWIDRWLDPAFAHWTLEDRLREVRCPMLAIYGSIDEYCSPTHSSLIAQRVGGPTTVEMLPGLGHTPHREDMGTVTRLIATFLHADLDAPMP